MNKSFAVVAPVNRPTLIDTIVQLIEHVHKGGKGHTAITIKSGGHKAWFDATNLGGRFSLLIYTFPAERLPLTLMIKYIETFTAFTVYWCTCQFQADIYGQTRLCGANDNDAFLISHIQSRQDFREDQL